MPYLKDITHFNITDLNWSNIIIQALKSDSWICNQNSQSLPRRSCTVSESRHLSTIQSRLPALLPLIVSLWNSCSPTCGQYVLLKLRHTHFKCAHTLDGSHPRPEACLQSEPPLPRCSRSGGWCCTRSWSTQSSTARPASSARHSLDKDNNGDCLNNVQLR